MNLGYTFQLSAASRFICVGYHWQQWGNWGLFSNVSGPHIQRLSLTFITETMHSGKQYYHRPLSLIP